MALQFNIQIGVDPSGNETGSISLYDSTTGKIKTVQHDHVNFEKIKTLVVTKNAADALPLFDPTPQIGDKFEHITERVTIAHGRVYFDGDEIDNSLTQYLLRLLEEGNETAWLGAANFFEKLQTNPNKHSREQLFTWLRGYPSFTITLDGDLVCYKGVEPGMKSSSGGRAIVNGEIIEGKIPYEIGSVVEMPRSEVVHNPREACSTGLHVATYPFAKSFTPGPTIAVLVNPRDVCSVPTDSGFEKMRVCRLVVKEIVTGEYTEPSIAAVTEDEDNEETFDKCDDPECGICDEASETEPEDVKPAEEPEKPAETPEKTSQSPLDQEPTYQKLMGLLTNPRGDETPPYKPQEVVAWLESECGVITTKDSLRRFKQRHGIVG